MLHLDFLLSSSGCWFGAPRDADPNGHSFDTAFDTSDFRGSYTGTDTKYDTGEPNDTGSSTSDSGPYTTETGFYSGPLLLTAVESSCSPNDQKWRVEGETLGWTGRASVHNLWETEGVDGWNEEHTVISVAFAPDGSSDTLLRELSPGESGDGYDPEISTAFLCGAHDEQPVMTFALRVYDLDGNFADCALWATDPLGAAQIQADPEFGPNPISNASELSACVVFM